MIYNMVEELTLVYLLWSDLPAEEPVALGLAVEPIFKTVRRLLFQIRIVLFERFVEQVVCICQREALKKLSVNHREVPLHHHGGNLVLVSAALQG